MITVVDTRLYESTEGRVYDPMDLSPNQKSLYDTIGVEGKKYAELYTLYKEIMPESSVRRIMAALLAKDLAEKTETGLWRQIKSQ
mgnify:FL=1